jgi:hypothetical protein
MGQVAGLARWQILIGNATAESGGNAGSDLGIIRFTDTGAYLGDAINVNRATGACMNTTGTWTTLSDASIKEHIQPYTRGLSAVLALKPVQFRYISGTPFSSADEPSRLLFGLLAGEVAMHVPEIVGRAEVEVRGESQAVDTLEPGNLVYALINAVQELAAKVAALEAGK